MQARLEEARNVLADEAMAYYPEVRMNRRLTSVALTLSLQRLPDLKADVKKIHHQQECEEMIACDVMGAC